MSTEATVREIDHTVRVDLTDAPPMRTADGRRRKPVGLRIRYVVTPSIARVDVTVEYRDAAELFPPVGEMPSWMRRIVDEHRPHDVDHPDTNRRTGMGGWPPEPVRIANTVLAVLGEQADRAVVLREAADRIDETRDGFPVAVWNGITWATAELRRMAAGAPAPTS